MPPAARPSDRARETDLRVAASAARAVRRDGIDQLALTRVASDAGYSSGVIYARCDDRSELMVLAWEKCIWPVLAGVLGAAFDAVRARDEKAMNAAVDEWQALCATDAVPDLGSAVEVIVAARRDEVIGEVVHHDILALLEGHGAGPGTSGVTRELVVLTAATMIGSALLNSAVPGGAGPAVDPRLLLELLADRDDDTETEPAALAATEDPERPLTGDPVRDALIAATEYVIARSGIHRATVSRIARRAGVSVGAIYGLYDNKEALILDCISVLHPPQARRDISAWVSASTEPNLRGAVSAGLAAFLAPRLASWRMFRIECLVSARHTPALSRLLEEYNSETMDELAHHFDAPMLSTVPARGTLVGLAVLSTVDPSIAGLDWRWFPIG